MTREDFLNQLPDLIKNYRSSPEVLAHIGSVQLLMIIGPTGVGKTTLINELGIPYVPSDTTRLIRPSEQNGLDMHFLTDYAQVVTDIKAGSFVQVALGASGDLYATRASSYPLSGWATMPVMSHVIPIFRDLGFSETLSAFITPQSYDEWMRRLENQQLDSQQLSKRMAEAKQSLEFGLQDAQTHFILNDQIEPAVTQLNKLLSGKADKGREQDARQAAQDNLANLKNQFKL